MLEFLMVLGGFAIFMIVFLLVVCVGFILVPSAATLGCHLEDWVIKKLPK